MAQQLPGGYVFDPDDPRAPSVEQWARMSAAERDRVVAMLPTEVPRTGRFASAVLGLDLGLEGERLRFFAGNAPLEDADEMIARLGSMLDKVIAGQEEAERLAGDLAAQLDEERRVRTQEREELERELAEARAEIARLKAGR